PREALPGRNRPRAEDRLVGRRGAHVRGVEPRRDRSRSRGSGRRGARPHGEGGRKASRYGGLSDGPMRIPRALPAQGLFVRLLVSLGAVLALSFTVAAAFSISAGRRTLERSAIERLDDVARSASGEIGRLLREREGDLKMIAGLEVMDDLLTRD